MASDSYFFITAALPYANGPLHFGHLAGVYLPADIYFRHCSLLERKVVFICGSDEHGVAITLGAEQAGKAYQTYVDEYHLLHQRLFSLYNINFSYYGRTTSPLHKKIAQEYFLELKKKKHLILQKSPQPFCKNCKRFVPDRYLEGTCAHCNYPKARGDECSHCGRWLTFEDLKEPHCQICKQANVEIQLDEQWYLDLPTFASELKTWLETRKGWKRNIQKYAVSLVESGLPRRAITRNIPWGVDVPGEEKSGKKMYVWFEAPIGYFSILKEFFECKKDPKGWKNFWSSKAKLIHFIGKDNIVFHTVVWPAMLMGIDDSILPANVPANMYVLLKDRQFSKSSGWYIDAMEALKEFGEDKMRYYLTTIIPEQDDSNFSWEDFSARVNGELIDNIANFCNRTYTLLSQHFPTQLNPENFHNEHCAEVIRTIHTFGSNIRTALDSFEFRKAVGEILRFGQYANRFLNNYQPWKLIKENANEAKEVISAALLYLMGLGSFLQPILPNYSNKIQSFAPSIDFKSIYRGVLSGDNFSAPMTLNFGVSLVIPKIAKETVEKKNKNLPYE